MADAPPPAIDPSKQAAAPDPAWVEDLAKAVSSMNRFLAKFAGLKAFAEARLTVADWTVLMYLSELKETRYPHLASLTGITEQRVARITELLVEAGLVSSVPSTDPAKPKPILSLTDAGRARLDTLNGVLQPLLIKALAGNVNILSAFKRTIPPLMRMGAP